MTPAALKKGMMPMVLQGHERPLTCLKFSRDGLLLFSSGLDGNVCVWRVSDGQRIGTYSVKDVEKDAALEIRLPAVFGIDVNHDGTLLLVGSTDQYAGFFDVASGKLIQRYETEGPVQSVEFCRHAKQDKFAVAIRSLSQKTMSHYIAVYQRESGAMNDVPITELCKIETAAHNVGTAKKVYWGPYDKTLITTHEIDAGEKGYICIWDAFKGTLLKKLECHSMAVSSVSFDNTRSIALTTSRDKIAKLWNVASNWEPITELSTGAPLNGGALSPLISKESKEKMFRQETFVTKSGDLLADESLLRQHAVVGGGQDAKDVTTTSSSEGKFEAQLWNIPLQRKIGELGGHIGPINFVAYFPDGRGFATGGEDGFIRVVDFDQEYMTDIAKFP